ncbi:MAG: DMT family transporter [Muribaculaceae bacterium]|nr:DMT family transporter [Muribaculaceae bacterium]
MLFHLGALITMIAWGASFVSTKVLLDNGLHPAEIYIYRFLLAYVMILAVSHKRILCNSVRDELLFAVCGLCAGSIYYIAENTALEYTLATNVSLITSLSPILTAIMIGFLYKSERPGRGLVIGSIMAFIGVGLVVFNSSFVINVNPLGDMLSLLSAISWAIYSILLRRLNATYTVMFIARKTFFYGVLTALPYLLIEPEIASPVLLLRPAVWGNILFLGCFASMLGYIVWAQAIKVLGAVKASNYLYFQPLVTLVVSAWLLGERISWIGYTGCLMILVGVWSSDWLERRAAMRR